MTKIYLDCGFYAGFALKKYVDDGTIDSSWQIYGFEANPEIDGSSVVTNDLKGKPLNIEIIRKAIWTSQTKLPFWISERHNASHIEGTTSNAPSTRVMVPAINFSKFVADLPKDAYIICSMDIEGSEYRVLNKMLKDGTIDRIKILDIEFHHRFMPEFDAEDSRALIKQIEDRGVKVILKVDLE